MQAVPTSCLHNSHGVLQIHAVSVVMQSGQSSGCMLQSARPRQSSAMCNGTFITRHLSIKAKVALYNLNSTCMVDQLPAIVDWVATCAVPRLLIEICNVPWVKVDFCAASTWIDKDRRQHFRQRVMHMCSRPEQAYSMQRAQIAEHCTLLSTTCVPATWELLSHALQVLHSAYAAADTRKVPTSSCAVHIYASGCRAEKVNLQACLQNECMLVHRHTTDSAQLHTPGRISMAEALFSAPGVVSQCTMTISSSGVQTAFPKLSRKTS